MTQQLTITKAQQKVDEWVKTVGVKYFISAYQPWYIDGRSGRAFKIDGKNLWRTIF